MVSNAREDLPEPDRPVNTISLSRGRSTETFWRLCSRAPRTTSRSLIPIDPTEPARVPGRTHVRLRRSPWAPMEPAVAHPAVDERPLASGARTPPARVAAAVLVLALMPFPIVLRGWGNP